MTSTPVPPQNLDAEESLVGALMLSPVAIEAAGEAGVVGSDFYRPSNGVMFDVACSMHDQGEPVDAVTLADRLKQQGKLDAAGGEGRVYEIAGLAASASNAGHYAGIVKEMAGLRRLIDAGKKIERLGWERGGQLDELLGQAEAALSSAVSPTFGSQFAQLSDGMDELLAEIREAIKTGKPKTGLLSNFTAIDKLMHGFHPGQLILIAARPSMGKSALAQNIAENVADQETGVAFVSLEMARKEVLIRSLSRAAHIDSMKLRSGMVNLTEQQRIAPAVTRVSARANHFQIEDDGSTTVQKLRAECRRLHRKGNLGLVVVDYMQLMVSSLGEDNRQQEISNISRSLKLLARELEIPVIALSQLNRKVEERADKRPVLSDLRDSGALEQDADVVMFIYRDDYYHDDSPDPGVADVIVAKNRNGALGTAKLNYIGRYTEFQNLIDSPKEAEAA